VTSNTGDIVANTAYDDMTTSIAYSAPFRQRCPIRAMKVLVMDTVIFSDIVDTGDPNMLASLWLSLRDYAVLEPCPSTQEADHAVLSYASSY